MASCVNAMSYSFGTSSRGIDPTLHVINSLGLPKPGTTSSGYAATNYLSSSKPTASSSFTDQDKLSAFALSRQNLESMCALKYDTAYTSKTYRPASAYSYNTSANKSTDVDPLGYGIVQTYSHTNQETKKSRRSIGGSENGVDPDENNNFMKDRRGRFCQCSDRLCERTPSHRTCELAQPKKLPCDYQEDRCIYWTYKRMRPNCGNHTHFETTPRLDELAMPKPQFVDCCASHTCTCDAPCFWHAPPCAETDPRCVDWDRLAAPKMRCQANYRPIQHVRKSALKARCSKRVHQLATPLPRKTTQPPNKEA
ncbi:hypothetical protein BsWGS_24063 [Bradybaena similaris]